jgi:hypothetical protein
VDATDERKGDMASAADVTDDRPGDMRAGTGRSPWLVLRWLGIGPADADLMSDARPQRGPWYPAIALISSMALVLAAHAANASRLDAPFAVEMFYLGVGLIMAPLFLNATLPGASRADLVASVLVVGAALFLLRVVRAPLVFVDHDEYLHWVSALAILDDHRLFETNPLFPIGPTYPGLSIATTAIAELTGLSVFGAGIVVLAAARFVFVGALFCLFEGLLGSARAAALACAFYMGCSTFVFFDTHFAYESLALPMMAFLLVLQQGLRREPPWRRPVWLAAALVGVAALTLTHHMTSYALAGLLIMLLVVDVLGKGWKGLSPSLVVLCIGAVAMPVLWSRAMGNPGAAYLGPVFENGLAELKLLLRFEMGRKLFTADDGTLAPLWQRVLTLGSVGVTCIGLALGFFKSLAYAGMPLAEGRWPGLRKALFGWRDGRHVLLTVLAFGFPIGIILRLTRSGWEIGNRISPFAYLGVAVILAILVATRLQGRSRSWRRAVPLSIVGACLTVAGIISAEGRLVLVPARYQVAADAASFEPMSTDAALWTREWLGPGNHFAADRINRLLLAVHGRQQVSTTLQHIYDAGLPIVAETLGPTELDILQRVEIDYLFADLRLTTGRPVVGAYFDGGLADQVLDGPPTAKAMLKFDAIDGVNRIFDNGYSVIYDVRSLSGRR